MKFSCEKNELQQVISVVSRACASKSPIPALEGLLLDASTVVKITGYDLKKGIYSKLDADVSETGTIIVGAKLFGEIIRRLPDGIVTVTTDYKLDVNVKCGKSEFNFKGLSADDYPELPTVDELQSVSLPQGVLKNMIDQTIFAVATNDIRPIYTGTLFELQNGTLTLVSIDGYRLAKRTERLKGGEIADGSFVVPGSTLSDVQKICENDSEDIARISVGTKHIAFTIGDNVIISRRLEGEFLNYRKSIPENFRHTVCVDRVSFLQTIERVSIIVSEKNSNPVRMCFHDGFIYCRCITSVGKAEDSCFCEGTGEELEIGFNDRYFTDALKAAGKDKLNICLNTASSPCVITAADGSKDFVYMILPVRIKAGE